MKSIWLFSDLDGTLLPFDKTLLPATIESVLKFRDMGGSFTLATGRSLQSARKYWEELQCQYPVIL